MNDILTLYTIGHSNITAADFLALLRQHQISVLVDVRSAPYSRYVPHFSKNKLEAFLQENGVEYRFAGEYLGGKPKDETPAPTEAPPDGNPRRTRYEAMMQSEAYQKGIQRLFEILAEAQGSGGRVAIMCSEGDPLNCHRHHLIARSLLDPAVKIVETPLKVRHILKNGQAEEVNASVFEVQSQTSRQPRLL